MKVAVGSKNQNKIKGVRDAFLHYYSASALEVVSKDVVVEEYGHPIDMKSTVEGAIKRAKDAFGDCDVSVGLESGLIEVPYTQTGYMEGSVCAVYDGKEYYIGIGPAFEWPPAVVRGIMEEGLDGSQAMRVHGITDHEKIGEGDGAISLFSKTVVTRRKQIELAVIMALVRILNPEYYRG